MVRIKSEAVRLNFASPALQRLVQTLSALAVAQREAGWWIGDLVITSGNDSRHSPTSRHYTDEAIDIRTHNFVSLAAKQRFRQMYEQALGPQFRVLLEGVGTLNEHLHAQVRKGHAFVPDQT